MEQKYVLDSYSPEDLKKVHQMYDDLRDVAKKQPKDISYGALALLMAECLTLYETNDNMTRILIKALIHDLLMIGKELKEKEIDPDRKVH